MYCYKYDGPLLCGFNVAIKGLNTKTFAQLRDTSDNQLFINIIHNSSHILHLLLPSTSAAIENDNVFTKKYFIFCARSPCTQTRHQGGRGHAPP